MNLTPHIPNYNPDFFTPIDLADAKRIILGHGVNEDSSRWEVETNWNKLLFESKNYINKDSLVLDWGCGIGRLSKMIIDTFGCKVVGVDINQKMLDYSKEFVNDDRFSTVLAKDFNTTGKFTFALSVWALQHSINPDKDLDSIKKSLTDDGAFFVFEETRPVIPITGDHPWFILKKSNFKTINEKFSLIETGEFPKELEISENNYSWWAFLRK